MKQNIDTLLLDSLINEESNVFVAKQELERCEANLMNCKERVQRIRNALEALGAESEKKSFATAST